jgi:V/A-type H+/Na+-transporting ATPase subunit B
VVGEEGLTDTDRRYVKLGSEFERALVHQPAARSLAHSMQAGWALLRQLPVTELTRLSDAQIKAHLAAATGA